MIKRFGILTLLFTLLTGISYATQRSDFEIPMDIDGGLASHLSQIGVYSYTITLSSNPAMAALGSTVAVYGVLTSTKANIYDSTINREYVELRATNTANFSSELLVPQLEITSTTRNTFYVFDPPVLAPDGLCMVVRSTTNKDSATVFYRYLSTDVLEQIWIPTDRRGIKSHSPEIYGVMVASSVVAGASADTLGTEGYDLSSSKIMVAQSSNGVGTSGMWYGMVATSTGDSGAYLVLEDTGSLIGDGTDLLPPLFYNVWPYTPWNSADVLTTNGLKTIRLPWPVIYVNGLTQQRSVATDRVRHFIRPRRKLR